MRTLRPAAFLAVIALAIPLLSPSFTRAQSHGGSSATGTTGEADAQARALYQAATTYYNTANYEQALRMYLDAYNLSARPALFYNIGLCYQALDDLPNALQYFRRYLDEGAPGADRRTVEVRVENLQHRLDQQRERERAAAAAATSASNGTTGHGATGDAATQRNDQGTNTAASDATPPPAHASSTESSGGVSGAAIGAYVGAGVGLAAYALFGVLTLSENGSLADGCGATKTCSDSDLSSLHTYALLADIGLGVAVVGGVVGTILLLTSSGSGEHDDAGRASTMVTPWISPSGAGAAAAVRF